MDAIPHRRLEAPDQSEGEVNYSPLRIEWQGRHLSNSAHDLLGRDADAFLHQSVSSPCLVPVAKAEGIWIEDADGRRYMDFHGNSVHHIGYGHPRLKQAISQQMDALPFAPRRFAAEVAVEMAEKLAEITPGDLSKCLMTTGGSDANEVALKVARAATGRFKTISFWDSFHGAGFGAASVGGEALFRSGAIGPLLAGCEHVPSFDAYRNPFGIDHRPEAPRDEEVGTIVANLIRQVLEKEGDVAAVIAEPMRAVPTVPPKGFWKQVRQACNDHGALLIFDEVPTGLGKTGRMFSCEHDDVVPDILVLGKALGGGMLPVAAAVCRPELDVAGGYAIGHYTHEKNPLLARAAVTTLAIIEDEELVPKAAELGDHAMQRLMDMYDRHPLIGDVRGRGLMLGLDLVLDRDSKEAARDAAERVLYACLDRGLSFKITMGSVLTLSPPLTITQAELDTALDIVDECLSEVA